MYYIQIKSTCMSVNNSRTPFAIKKKPSYQDSSNNYYKKLKKTTTENIVPFIRTI